MNPRQKQDELGRFTVVGKERLSKRVRGIRLSVTIDEAIEALPEAERAEWLRRVVTQAAVRELLVKKQSATVSS